MNMRLLIISLLLLAPLSTDQETIASGTPSVKQLEHLAHTYHENGRYLQEISLLNQALQLDPKAVNRYRNG